MRELRLPMFSLALVACLNAGDALAQITDTNPLATAIQATPMNTLTVYQPKSGMTASNFQSLSGNTGSYMTYMGGTQWDPARNAFHLIAKNAGGGTQWVHGRYVADTDTYEIVSRSGASLLPGASTFGHMYEGVAVDPHTGAVFHNGLEEVNVGRFDPVSGTWSTISGASLYSPPTPVLKFHEARNELVFIKSGASNVRVWNGSSWRTAGTVNWPGNVANHAVGGYNPVREHVLFGGGDNGVGGPASSRMFIYDREGKVRQIADAPSGLTVEDGALFLVDYTTGDDLILRRSGGWNRTIYRLNANYEWSTETIDGTLPASYGASSVTIHEYHSNVIIDYNSGSPRFLIYRTGDGSSVPPPPPPPPPSLPTVSLSASPGEVAPSGTTTLSWSTTNASSCVASGGWSGTKATSGSEAVGPLTSATDFDLECSNGEGGVASDSVRVTIAAVDAPTLDFSADSNTVSEGGFTTLMWTSSRADECEASDGWSGKKAVSGSENVGPLAGTTRFELECSGSGGSIERAVVVEVVEQGLPVITLTADPDEVPASSVATLSWNAIDANSCTASGGWSGVKSPSGTESVGPLTADTEYSLACSGNGGTATKSVSVRVLGDPSGPTPPPPSGQVPAEADDGGSGAIDPLMVALLSSLVAGASFRRAVASRA